ncbi:uncharacterized protein prr11 [Clarias gariepinus]|uniref:proline-rich protein 11 n=1 Tax=Clarias gariepinus TaxID=13013 RepID=UPI00234C3155|nr:proline-rich protein 11 [Clarias gariepinus]
MAGSGRLSRHFQTRRKKNGSSRRFALKAKQALTPVSGSQANGAHVELAVEKYQKSEKLSISLRSGRLFNVVGNILQPCRHIINHIWTGFCNVLFFWRVYAQRVEILHQKVEELQNELQLLRNNALLPPVPGCSDHQSTTVIHHHQHRSVAPPIALLPPPPPPPPPPPLPPPPTQVPKRLPLMPKNSNSHSSLQEKVERHVVVTLKDLQKVQLRKVTANTRISISPDGKRTPLITLAELQKVRLRRVQCSFPSPKKISQSRSPRRSPMKLLSQLRKLQTDRILSEASLCNKENVENYSGISAIMNKGLESN